MMRKCVYVLDMVLLGLLFFSFEHTLFRENPVVDHMLDAALILRITIPFLLYRYERMACWPTLAFTILFGAVVFSGILQNTIMNMGDFPSVVFDSKPSLGSYMEPRDTTGAAVMRGIIYWIWLIPIAVYIVQISCKLTKRNGYPWYYFIGGIVFKDKVGKTFLRMAIMLAIAYLIGYEMQENLSFFTLISLPLVCYYYWNKHIDRNPRWLEYVVFFVGLYIFDMAQYKFDNERIMFLAVSAVIIFAVCCWMAFRAKSIFIPILTFVIAGFLLSSISLGYNIYQSIEGARMSNYVNVGLSNCKGYMYIKRSEIVNGKEIRYVGVRDRYHTTIPCEYSYVLQPKYTVPLPNVLKRIVTLLLGVLRKVIYWNKNNYYEKDRCILDLCFGLVGLLRSIDREGVCRS